MQSSALPILNVIIMIVVNALELALLYAGWVARGKLPISLRSILPSKPLPPVLASLPFLIGGYILFYFHINDFSAAIDGVIGISVFVVGLLIGLGAIKK